MEARKSGNDGLVATIQKKISILEDATRRLKSDAESENEKVRTKSNELVTVATTGFTKKMLNWTKNNLALLNPSTFLIGVGMPEAFEKLKNDTYRGIIDGSTSVYNIIKDSILGLINGVSDWIKNHFNLSKILGFDKAEENKNAVDLGKTVGSLVQPPKNPITEATKQLNVDIITRKSKAITEKAKEANIGQHFPMPMVIPTGPNITNTDARSSTNIQNVHPSRPSSYDTNFSGYSKGE